MRRSERGERGDGSQNFLVRRGREGTIGIALKKDATVVGFLHDDPDLPTGEAALSQRSLQRVGAQAR
jgi:hypothetical protein